MDEREREGSLLTRRHERVRATGLASLARRHLGTNAAKHAFLLVGAMVTVFPFYWMLTTSFKSFIEAGQFPPTLIPKEWHFENWAEAWRVPRGHWPEAFRNTILVGSLSVLGDLTTAVLAAYAFARMRFRGRDLLFGIFLATLMIPGEAVLIPNFVLMSKRFLNLYDTYAAQILPFVASAFAIFLLRQFFLSIPKELQDAATIDGAGHTRYLWSVALPLVQPALITVALLQFLGSWNAFLWPLLVTSRAEIQPIQVIAAQFASEFGANYHLLMAGASFAILPMVAVFLVAQKYFIEGVARTGIRD